MTEFAAYAKNFEWYPQDTDACRSLEPILTKLNRVEFSLRVRDASKNQGQQTSDFDDALKAECLRVGGTELDFSTPPEVPQKHDFAFALDERLVVVEVEKSNREKILRDILKCHAYLDCGADFALVVLAKNYSHKHGIWNLYQEGVQRFSECQKYGFGTPDKLGRILLVGYEQFDAETDAPLTKKTRDLMRRKAATTRARRTVDRR